MRLDMVFQLSPSFRLGIEYDGAFWHQGREEADYRKGEHLRYVGEVDAMMRLREEPLDLLDGLDVVVPRGSSGQVCAQLALLHIGHCLWEELEFPGLRSIWSFLEGCLEPLEEKQIGCPRCRKSRQSLPQPHQAARP